MVFQVGSNANDALSVSLSSGFTVSGIASIANIPTTTPGTGPDAQGGSLLVKTTAGYRFTVCTAANAQTTLENIDKFIQAVDSCRAALGAVQNRMESTIRKSGQYFRESV